MKAIVFDRYGPADVLTLKDVEVPVVKDDEVRVRVIAGGANAADWRNMRGDPCLARLATGLRRPRGVTILGSDMAGTVEAVGADVTLFRPGDEVYGEVDSEGSPSTSAFARTWLGLKPANLTFEQAAAVPMAGLTALQALRDVGRIQAGQTRPDQRRVGRHRHDAPCRSRSPIGAHVTGVCSTRNVGPRPIDRRRPRHRLHAAMTSPLRAERYDLIVRHSRQPLVRCDCRHALVPKGTLVVVGGIGGGGGRIGRARGPELQGGPAVTVREPAPGPRVRQAKQGGPPRSEGTHRRGRSRRSSTGPTHWRRCLRPSGIWNNDMLEEKSWSPCRTRRAAACPVVSWQPDAQRFVEGPPGSSFSDSKTIRSGLSGATLIGTVTRQRPGRRR